MGMAGDAEVDATYIRSIETTITTQHVAEAVALDSTADGRIPGIEILDARTRCGDPDVFRRVVLEDDGLAGPRLPGSWREYVGARIIRPAGTTRFAFALHVVLAHGGRAMERLDDLIRELPSELQQEVADFAQFLIEKRVRKPEGQLRLDWRGALRDMRDQYTSVELQHKIREWW